MENSMEIRQKIKNKTTWGLPWWRSGWESACQCKGTRVRALVWEDPTCRRATWPVSHNYWAFASGACAPNKRGHDSERPVHRDEAWPPLATTRESPCTETKTQHSQKKKKKKRCFLKKQKKQTEKLRGTSLTDQWLRLCISTAGGTGSIPDWRTKILHSMQSSQRKIKK